MSDARGRLAEATRRVKDIVATIPGIKDLKDDYRIGKPELRVRIADLNLTPRLVAKLLTQSYGRAVGIIVVAYFSASRTDIDATTEIAALVVVAAGVLAGGDRPVESRGQQAHAQQQKRRRHHVGQVINDVVEALTVEAGRPLTDAPQDGLVPHVDAVQRSHPHHGARQLPAKLLDRGDVYHLHERDASARAGKHPDGREHHPSRLAGTELLRGHRGLRQRQQLLAKTQDAHQRPARVGHRTFDGRARRVPR